MEVLIIPQLQLFQRDSIPTIPPGKTPASQSFACGSNAADLVFILSERGKRDYRCSGSKVFAGGSSSFIQVLPKRAIGNIGIRNHR
jgi:hypothetical protein